jgi:hypothetical protein
VIKRIGRDWLHWSIGRHHFGYHRYGNCWRLAFSRTKYTNQTFYTFWRLFVAVEHL